MVTKYNFSFSNYYIVSSPSTALVSIPDPIGSGVARTWFGFRYQDQDQDQDSQYYSFNVMHINSYLKDYGLLTQLHGSFKPHGFRDFDINEEFKKPKTNFYSRSKTNKGKRSTTGSALIQERFVSYKYQIPTVFPCIVSAETILFFFLKLE